MKKTILITGAGSGFGLDASLALAQRGHQVIAATETQAQAQELKKIFLAKKLTAQIIVLDVTQEKDQAQILNYNLDVLINNAGQGQTGPLAEIDIERIKKNFEVNVFASIKLTQMALEPMIKKDAGRIIFISSIAGRIAMPFFGPYCMTKFSLSCAADCLRQEMRWISKNIKICLVEPGAYHTGFNQKMMATKFEWLNRNSHFAQVIDKIKKAEELQFNSLEVKSNKSIVKQIIKAVESKNPKLRYVAPWWQGLGIQILRIFGK